MKLMTRLGLVLGALAVLPALALAGGGEGKGHGRWGQAHPDKLAKYDANKDGELDRAERQAMRAERRAAMVAKYDADGDGELGDAERAAMKRDRILRRFQSMDTDGDGSISLAEFEATAGQFGFRHRGRHGK